MAMLAPMAELVLSGAEGIAETGEAGNMIGGIEAGMKTFKDEIVKGSIFGVAEGALFGAGEKLYDEIKGDLGIVDSSKQPIKKPHRKRKV